MRLPSSAVVNITWSKLWIRFAHLLLFHPNDCSMWDWFIYSDNGILTPDRCKPFDSAADGYITNSTVRFTRILTPIIVSFVRGEGAVAIVIKPLEAALADNDHIYAIVRSNSLLTYPALIILLAGFGHRYQQQWVRCDTFQAIRKATTTVHS